jgi:hypothetical protein
MKTLLLLTGLALSSLANAQWTNKFVDNGDEDSYNIAWTDDEDGSFLKLEKLENGAIIFYISGGYVCEKTPSIDLIFNVKGISKKYSVVGAISKDNKTVFMIYNILEHEVLEDFTDCKSLKIRINDPVCGSSTFDFNMKGSESALSFVVNQ